ncbi:MFS transporter [Planomicrobium sp. CPCC 101110]|uniref:MFS transporter n=1 Tax=Planomicrobium sp. CPCC 101110 TaxID=2599619 RepID=UPI0011B419B9|nr:MFS transporter [Planomicrobium sp. CPCC 101110]TWT27134.1 MFS transporter [Planomicrobium sp. CPCC 101110]
MDKNYTKLWTKDFVVVSGVNFFLTLIFNLLIVTIGLYAVGVYGASTSQAGLAAGISIIGTLIGRIIVGREIDRIGTKKTLIAGLVLFTVTTLLYFVEFSLLFLLITRFLNGFTLGIAVTACGTIIAQVIPDSRKGEGIGYFSMSTTLSTAIGPFIGIYMSQNGNFQMIFTLCLILGLFSLIVAFFVKAPSVVRPESSEETKGIKLSQFIEPKAVPIAIITLAIAFCYSSILSFINFYASEIELVKAASFFFLVYAIAVLVSRPITGRLLDTKGANFVMYPAFLLLAAGLLLLSTATTSAALLLSAGLIGLGFGNMQSCTQAIAVKLTAPHRMGLATSTFFIFLDAGIGFGPYILGFIIPVTGFRSMYVLLSLFALATSALYYFLHGRKKLAKNAAATVS